MRTRRLEPRTMAMRTVEQWIAQHRRRPAGESDAFGVSEPRTTLDAAYCRDLFPLPWPDRVA